MARSARPLPNVSPINWPDLDPVTRGFREGWEWGSCVLCPVSCVISAVSCVLNPMPCVLSPVPLPCIANTEGGKGDTKG